MITGLEPPPPPINASRIYHESPLYQVLIEEGLTQEAGMIQRCAVNDSVLYHEKKLLRHYMSKLSDPYLLARGSRYPNIILYRQHVLDFLNQCE